MTPFFTILTNYGKTVLAQALAAQQPLEIPHMAAGDGGGAYYDPVEEQTNLRNELWRGDLNDLRTDANVQGQVIAEAIIPMGIDGDWTVREIGLFDTNGGLIAVGKYPENYIPPASSGAKSQVHISIIIKIDNVAAVQLIVDHGQVLASKLYVTEMDKRLRQDLNSLSGPSLIGGLGVYITGGKYSGGAKGDGVTDDFTALKSATEYANANKLPIMCPPGLTVKIKGSESITIKHGFDF
ncbi:phage tail protein, partial [Providencia rettgeri]